MKRNRLLGWLLLPACCLVSVPRAASAGTADFEDLSLPSNSFENGADLSGSFTSGGAVFNNFYDTTYGSWEGWAYANQHDELTNSFTNQYSAYNLPNGGGADGSKNFAVGYTSLFNLSDVRITLPTGMNAVSAEITNTTYAALTMLDGDPNGFARKFGTPPPDHPEVPDGQWPDWFKLTISGLDAGGHAVGTVVDFYLADYRRIAGAAPYVIDHWTPVDLSSLADAQTLVFTQDSSDTGDFGINTPTYFALDNLVVAHVPEPSGLVLAGIGFLFAGWFRHRQR